MVRLNTVVEGHVRVHKSIARRMYDSGYPVKLLPCKVNPYPSLSAGVKTFIYIYPITIKRGNPEHLFDDGAHEMPFSLDPESFESMVNAYRYYNCCAELGYYPHYYVTQADLEKWVTSDQFN